MSWNEQYPKEVKPELSAIGAYIGSPLWAALCTQVEQTYGVAPLIEHSRCSGAPGWNVKYKKSGRSLCTVYPASGYFTCLVAIGGPMAAEVELGLYTFSDYTRTLYRNAMPFNGYRWLMIDVRDAQILQDTLALIAARAKRK